MIDVLLERRRFILENLGNYSWLMPATQQAIMDAFLDDGWAVIKATNAYLNQLAASDRDKATALAGFINEDPMMVCSVVDCGVERIITPNNTLAYIDTGVSRTQGTYELCRASISRVNNENFLCGAMLAGSPYNRNYIKQNSNGTLQLGHGDVCPNGAYLGVNNVFDFECYVSSTNGAYLKWGSNTITSSGNRNISSNTFKLFQTDYSKNSYPSSWRIHNKFYLYEIDKVTLLRDFAPFITNKARAASECYPQMDCPAGTRGMIDILTGTFYPNANSSGSFSIEYGIYENGSWVTWTPSTP